MNTFIPAAPGHSTLTLRRRGRGFVRRAIIGWLIADDYHVRARPVVVGDTERMAAPDGVIFPDGHVEDLDGLRAWRDLITFRTEMEREAKND